MLHYIKKKKEENPQKGYRNGGTVTLPIVQKHSLYSTKEHNETKARPDPQG